LTKYDLIFFGLFLEKEVREMVGMKSIRNKNEAFNPIKYFLKNS